jgi:hypothetical protein
VTAAEAVAAANRAGVVLCLDDQDRLVAVPAGRLHHEVREAIRTNKDRIRLLRGAVPKERCELLDEGTLLSVVLSGRE